jgi:hypothetical protein
MDAAAGGPSRPSYRAVDHALTQEYRRGREEAEKHSPWVRKEAKFADSLAKPIVAVEPTSPLASTTRWRGPRPLDAQGVTVCAGARRGQAIGSDMPTGLGAAAGAGICITGSSTGESAISPRAA